MARARWNWLNELRRRLGNLFSKSPPPSKFTRRRPLFERLGPVEALEDRWVLSPTLSLMDIACNEGTVLGFEVWLDSPNERSITIQFSTADGMATSPDDYLGVTSGTFTIPPTTLPANAFPTYVAAIGISTVNNSVDDGDRQFTINIESVAGATLGDGNATGTIVDDDVVPIISIVSLGNAAEYDAETGAPLNGGFRISRTEGMMELDVIVNFSISGSATNGTDYNTSTPLTTSVTIPAGQLEATLSELVVAPIEDANYAEGNENVILTIITATIGTSSAIVNPTQSSAIVTIGDAPKPLLAFRTGKALKAPIPVVL